MTILQVNLPDQENEIISVFKIRNKIKTKEAALIQFIKEKGGEYL